MKRICACLCLFCALSLGASPATAEVKLRLNAEGRKVIFNESTTQRSRRLSPKLVAVPDTDLEPLIQRHSGAQNLDPRLVKALIQVESGYNVRARSNKGAMGLMQLMPGTAASLAVSDAFDPDQNLRGGTAYLRRMLDRFAGRLEWAVAAYNAGPGAVERYNGIPPYSETRNYVKRVLSLYQGYETAISLPMVAGAFATGPIRKPYLTRNAQNRMVLTTAVGGVR